ncbi:Nramp family divalent metal transporter [Psychroserpens damuponensis]|uniref:Nramp family divalent metal transporter n=1 Tax=Psychroserpens damuponensis TaxID=943936 RepID=UPI00058BDF4C|nr:Nramp family divalent metal transporter [Psychroserpens damuponensis]
MIKHWLKNIGPGPLVAAAFIGPGTVTVCTIAGITHGFTLLWAMLLSIAATIVLQEMSARLGVVSQKGLSEVIRAEISNPFLKGLVVVLILSAIVIGNAAYEAGNISGGVLGLQALSGGLDANASLWSIVIGVVAFVLLYMGNYKVLEKALVALVVLMSLAFMVTAILTKPNLSQVFKGLFVPNFSSENVITVIALVGTTVVPYNLFLHASLVKEKWKNPSDLKFARKDTIIAVILGGVVSMCIIISAAAIRGGDVQNAADLARGLEPLFGDYAKCFLSVGLFAAGITSAITAPLAAAYVATGCLGWSSNMKSLNFRLVWMFILGLGVLLSSIGFKSIEIIKFAQVANGLLLPVVAGFLLWVMNKTSILGKYKNSIVQNVFGFVIFGIALFLGVKSVLRVFELV